MDSDTTARGRKRRRRMGRAVRACLILLVLLVGARAALPVLAELWINRRLGDLAGYRARVGDIDMHLLRGAYEIRDFSLVKSSGTIPDPLLYAASVRARLEWRGFLGHPLTADMEVDGVRVNLVRGRDAAHSQLGMDLEWRKILRRLSVGRVGRFRMRDGEIRFLDVRTSPDVDLRVRDVDADLDNLVGAGGGKGAPHAADFRAEGRTPGRGAFSVHIRMDPEARRPDFSLAFSLDSLDLGGVNDAVKAYTGTEVENGRLDMTARASASGGRYRGRVRADLQDFDMGNPLEEKDDPLEALKETVAEGVGEILEGQSDEPGEKPPAIPFSGRFPEQVQDVWSMSGYLMKESFDKALDTEGG